MRERETSEDPARFWCLDPDIVFLNHGSFGACPGPVLEQQSRLRERMEREPVRFFARDLPELLHDARVALSDFVGASPDDLAFVPNVTNALNSVLRSLPLRAGDEIVVSNHEYNATRNIVDFVAQGRGCQVKIAEIPFPLASSAQALEAVVGALGPRTRLVVVDHVTSQTGLVMPVSALMAECGARDVDVLIDGAHAPGMLDLSIRELAPAWYAGNCHKWICAPKGAGFLYVRPDLQESARPACISHGANAGLAGNARFRAEFEWTGTGDPTAALAVPTAIGFMGSLLPGGWPELRARNRSLCLEGRRLLAEAMEVALPCPDAMIGSLATLPLPASPRFPDAAAASALAADALHDALFDQHGIEVPVLRSAAHAGRLIRISAQLYNRREHYEALAGALRALL